MTRLLVIGLDGGTRTVTGRADARLPNLDALTKRGAHAVLRSTVPPITSAAWASMFTGWNPGRHGMYDFRVLDTTRYAHLWNAGHSAGFDDEPRFVTSRRWRGDAVWDVTGDGATVAVSCVPMTYPAWPVNGTMVAGFPLPNYARNYSYPPDRAGSWPPLLEGSADMAAMTDAEVAVHCRRLVERQADVVRSWLEPEGPDLMVAVFQGTDFAQHRLWKYLDTPDHPLCGALLDLYRLIDEVLGTAHERLGDNATIAVVSDHGFGPHPRTQVHTDEAFRQAGLLTAGGAAGPSRAKRALQHAPGLRRRLRLLADRLPSSAGERLAASYSGSAGIDWSQTKAYRFPLYPPAEGVVINVRGRQPEGCVEEGAEYEQARDDAIAALSAIRDTDGRAVVQWAKRREDVFEGEYLSEAPDVVALLDPAFKGSAGVGELFSPVPDSILESYSGVHAMEGIFAIAGPGIAAGTDLGQRNITDVAPTLMALLGVEPSDRVDGAIMTEALATAAVMAEQRKPHAVADTQDPVMTPEEEAELERSLRSLGYIE